MGNPASYHNVFWYAAILVVIILILWIVAVRDPEHSCLQGGVDPDAPKPKMSEGFKSLPCWAGLIAFAGFALGTAMIQNLSTSFFSETMGMDRMSANGALNIANIAVFVGSVGVGILLNKIVDFTKRMILLIASSIVLAVCFALTYTISIDTLTPWLIAFGLFNGVVPPIYFTMVADIAPRPELASVAATLLTCGQALGGGLCFSFVGSAIVAAGWGAGTFVMIAAGVVLVLGSVFLFILMRNRANKVEQA